MNGISHRDTSPVSSAGGVASSGKVPNISSINDYVYQGVYHNNMYQQSEDSDVDDVTVIYKGSNNMQR